WPATPPSLASVLDRDRRGRPCFSSGFPSAVAHVATAETRGGERDGRRVCRDSRLGLIGVRLLCLSEALWTNDASTARERHDLELHAVQSGDDLGLIEQESAAAAKTPVR